MRDFGFPKANESRFLRALKVNPIIRREIKKSFQIHISHIHFLPMFFRSMQKICLKLRHILLQIIFVYFGIIWV